MADNSTQSNIDDLVKELSRPQGVPPKSTEPTISVSGSSPAPAKPVTPPAPTRPTPLQAPTMPTKPVAPAIKMAPAAPKTYQSNIRTMGDDLSQLKSGQKPQGINVPRTVQPAPTPAPKAPGSPNKPAIPPPPVKSQLPHIGPQSAPKPFMPAKPSAPAPKAPVMPKPTTPLPKAPAMPAPAPEIPTPPPVQMPKGKKEEELYTPQSGNSNGGVNRNLIFISIAVVAVILAVVYWFFLIRQPSVPVAQVPTVSVTPTSTPLSTLQSLFPGQGGTIVLPASGNPSSAFTGALSTQTIAPGSFGVLNVQNSVASGSVQTLDPFSLMDRFLISYPSNLKSNESAQDSAIMAFGQQESFNSKGNPVTGQAVTPRLVLVTQVASSSMADLQTWEPDMASSLAGLFGFDQTKAATKNFQTSTYNGVQIRFENFSYPDHTIDYALVPDNGNYYLILTSSRESMFAAINAFRPSGQ